uniref:hypothetical protein n=1 Tax=Roseivirga sp. TaxID=1964215 RepID=UPI004047667B
MKTTIQSTVLALFMVTSVQTVKAQFATNGDVIYTDLARSSQQDLSKLPKMDRDIVILQNVLNDLFKGSREGVFYSSRGAKGMYISGKGVFFNINYDSYAEVRLLDELKKKAKDKVIEIDQEERTKEREESIKSLSESFLLNYGSILTELKDNEKIILNVNYSDLRGSVFNADEYVKEVYVASIGNLRSNRRMVSSILAKDLKDLLSGKLSEEVAKTKIAITNVDEKENQPNDSGIMAGILDDVFQSTFDGTFRKSGRTSWTYFEGFGLMFDMSFSSDKARELRVYYAGQRVEKEQDPKSLEAEKEETKADFEKLIELAKESLVTYGRTLRSVKSDEVIILNMNFSNGFRDTDLPKVVRIQVNKSQIEAFSKGSISLEQLKKEIDIKKLSSSTNNSEALYFPASHSEVFDVAPVRATGRVKGQN